MPTPTGTPFTEKDNKMSNISPRKDKTFESNASALVPLPQCDEDDFVKGNKSVNYLPTKGNLVGKKTFNVMKVMTDSVNEQAKLGTQDIIQRHQLGNDDKRVDPTLAFSFNENCETKRAIKETPDEVDIEIMYKYKKKNLDNKPFNQNEQGEESNKEDTEKSTEILKTIKDAENPPVTEVDKLSNRDCEIVKIERGKIQYVRNINISDAFC